MESITRARFVPAEQRIGSADVKVAERRKKAIQQRLDAETWVIQWLESHQKHEWLSGVAGLKIPDQDVNELVREIESVFSGGMRRHAINFLARELERGIAEHAWQVKVPGRVIALRLPSPQINADTFTHLMVADALQVAYLKGWAELGARGTTREVRNGDILLSAVMFAGVLNADRLIEFAANFETGFRHWGGHSWVEWQAASGAWERVVLDEFTTGLILRRLAQPNLSNQTIVWVPTLVIRAIEDVAPLRRAGIRSLKRLITVLRMAWAVELPPFIYYWACGNTSSAVLPSRTFFRVLSKKRWCPDDPVTIQATASSSALADNISQSSAPILTSKIDSNSPWWRRLRKLIASGKTPLYAPEAVRRVSDFVAEHTPGSLPVLVGEWLIDQLKPWKEGGKGTRVSSARTQLQRIDRRMTEMLQGRSPAECAWRWEDDVVEIVESVPESYRRQVKIALLSFHACLERKGIVPPLSVDLGQDGESMVDANLLTETEFRRVRAYLAEHDRLFPGAATEVAAILARRACLRRNELIFLKQADWIGSARPYLVVRANERRTLKKDHSRRKVDLQAVCTADEFAVLNAYRARLHVREGDEGGNQKTGFLFPDQSSVSEPQSEALLIDPIVRAIAQVTGDDSLRFHHLRHTGINVNLLSSVESLLPGTSSIIGDRPPLIERPAFLESQVGITQPLRPRVWAVAQSAGHATPETTLGSYFHLCDWVLGGFAQRRLPEIDDATRAAIAACTVTNLRVLRHRFETDRVSFPGMLLGRVDPTRYAVPDSERFEDFAQEAITRLAQPDISCPNPIVLLGALQGARRQGVIHYTKAVDPDLLATVTRRVEILESGPLRGEARRHDLETIGGVSISRRWETPPLPQVNDEKLQILRLGQALWQRAQEFPLEATRWLAQFIAGRYPRGNAMQLDSPELAREWLSFLTKAIDVAVDGRVADHAALQVIVSVRPSMRSRHSVDAQRSAWSTALNGLNVRWSEKSLNEQLSHGIGAWGTIDVWIEPPASADALSRKNWRRTGSVALEAAAYYLLLMLPEEAATPEVADQSGDELNNALVEEVVSEPSNLEKSTFIESDAQTSEARYSEKSVDLSSDFQARCCQFVSDSAHDLIAFLMANAPQNGIVDEAAANSMALIATLRALNSDSIGDAIAIEGWLRRALLGKGLELAEADVDFYTLQALAGKCRPSELLQWAYLADAEVNHDDLGSALVERLTEIQRHAGAAFET